MAKTMSEKRKRAGGFTLIETLVSIGILAIIATIVLAILFVVLRSSAKTQIQQELKQNGEEAVSIMTDFIRRGSAVSCTPSTIIVSSPNGGTTILSCDEDENRIASASATTVYLTSASVTCSEMTVSCSGSGDSYVQFSFTLYSGDGLEAQARNFTGKALMLNR